MEKDVEREQRKKGTRDHLLCLRRKGTLAPCGLLFPNPASEVVRAAFTLPAGLPDPWLTVRDLYGRELYRVRLGTGVHLLDLPLGQLATGIYLCSLDADGVRLVAERIVVGQ